MMKSSKLQPARRGFLLVVVLATVVLLSLACYEYADRSVADREASAQTIALAQARMAAMSGVDVVLAAVSDPEFASADLVDEEFLTQLTERIVTDDERIGVTVMPIDAYWAPWSDDSLAMLPGLISESGKINLNTLAELEDSISLNDQRAVLVELGLTESAADAILDFIDSDTSPRPFGTESDSGDVIIRNRPLDSLDDLLVLDEVDSILLYGEDVNLNGRLDPNEDDGEESPPLDDADGILTPGLASFVTVYGREANVDSTGEPRINVNQDSTDTLYSELSGVLDSTVADFIVAYREKGPANQSSGGRSGGRGGGFSAGGGFSGGGSSGGGSSGSGASGSGASSGSNEITSLAQLIDAEVDGVTNPLTSSDLPTLLRLYDFASTTDATTISGRLDLNAATAEMLVLLGGLEESIATTIADRDDWEHPVEILTDGLVNVATFQRLEPLLTTGGRTFSFSSVGYVADGPMVRVDAIVDASTFPPRILRLTDMTRIGVGRPVETIRPSVPFDQE